ncbi:MAG: hypothetical protein N2595_06720, partial [bacterium]|nr:hypothetical protein [bacterium]
MRLHERVHSSAPTLPRPLCRAANFRLIVAAVALMFSHSMNSSAAPASFHVVQCTASNAPPSLAAAITRAQALHPSEDRPVLIQLAPGVYQAHDLQSGKHKSIWRLDLRHIYFAGAGYEFTRIVCGRIIVDPDAVTGFRDVQLDAVVELGDSFLPVHNVQVREVEMRDGQLDGLWRDAAGAVHLSRMSAEEVAAAVPWRDIHGSAVAQLFSNIFLLTNQLLHAAPPRLISPPTRLLAPPDPDASNTFVLKSGDTMTGALRLPQLFIGLTNARYKISGCNANEANGLYYATDLFCDGVTVFGKPDRTAYMFRRNYSAGYAASLAKVPKHWVVAATLTSQAIYCSSGLNWEPTPPGGLWSNNAYIEDISGALAPRAHFGGARIESVAEGILSNDAVTVGQMVATQTRLEHYVQNVASSHVTHVQFISATNYLLHCMEESVNLLREEQGLTQAFLLTYVDTQDAAHFAAATNASAAYADTRFLQLAGGTLTGDLVLAGGAALRAAVRGTSKHAVLASIATASGKRVTATNLVEAFADDGLYGGAAVVKLYPHTRRADGDAYVDASGTQLRNVA